MQALHTELSLAGSLYWLSWLSILIKEAKEHGACEALFLSYLHMSASRSSPAPPSCIAFDRKDSAPYGTSNSTSKIDRG